ncbi:MAG: UDP-N-acetylmuramoyl-L-alanine--D-glutamate ligase, partial [bacterium]|nr:UDP-N-acetylmuramoyl-L-alanine--D-glutamate ligase [bacterium]
MHEFIGKRVTVMGLGLHGGGLATAAWFLGHGAHVTVTDLKTRRELTSSVRELLKRKTQNAKRKIGGRLSLVLGRHRAEDFRSADFVVQNPGVPRESKFLTIARTARVPIENEASLFLKMMNAERKMQNKRHVRIIAVTGTRGKSTTSALIAELLRADGRTVFLAGNIRIPMLGVLDEVVRAAKRGPVEVVLELSSWHCELLSPATGGPDIAVLTNLYPDHLNRYRSLRAYAAAKARLVRFQSQGGIVIANREQPIVRAMAALSPGHAVWYAQRPPRRTWSGYAMRDDECVQFRSGRGTSIVSRRLLQLPGEHNAMNLLAAVAAARECGVESSAIRRGLRTFHGLPGRLEVVRRSAGITYVNDTCATSPDGAIAALRALTESGIKNRESRKRNIVLIAGGTDKNLDFHAWAKEVVRRVRVLVFLPGTATGKMRAALRRIPDSRF